MGFLETLVDFVKNMTKEDVRTIVIIVCLLCFLYLCSWAVFSKRAKARFDEAAQLPLTDDDLPVSPVERKE